MPHKWWVLSVTSVGALLSALNFSTLIIALPALIRGLHATLLQAMWVMLAYMVAQTIIVLMAGSLADWYGRSRVFFAGALLFVLVSLISGFAIHASWLIFLRVVQGIGGALMMANAMALVADAFPKYELGRALGINAMVVAVGQIVGPVLGGFLTTDFGWRWVFWFNVPVGLIVVVLSRIILDMRTPVTGSSRTLDGWGIVTYIIGVTGLLIGLTWGALQGWHSAYVDGGLILFVLFLPTWLWLETKHPFPLLHLPMFRNRIFAIGVLVATLAAINRLAMMFLLIFYFQGAKGDSALTAGILSIPLALGLLVFSPLSGWLSDRFGSTIPATLGLFMIAVGTVGLAVDLRLHTPYWRLATWMFISGIGSGFFNSPNTSNIMNAAGATHRGEASGVRALTTNTGMILSIALSLAMISSSLPRTAMLSIFAGTAVGLHGASKTLQDFIHGLQIAFWLMAAVVILATVISLFRGSDRAVRAEEQKGI